MKKLMIVLMFSISVSCTVQKQTSEVWPPKSFEETEDWFDNKYKEYLDTVNYSIITLK